MQARKKKKQTLNNKGFLCVDSQEKIEMHQDRENNQGKVAKTREESATLLHYDLAQQIQQYRGIEGKMTRKIENCR